MLISLYKNSKHAALGYVLLYTHPYVARTALFTLTLAFLDKNNV